MQLISWSCVCSWSHGLMIHGELMGSDQLYPYKRMEAYCLFFCSTVAFFLRLFTESSKGFMTSSELLACRLCPTMAPCTCQDQEHWRWGSSSSCYYCLFLLYELKTHTVSDLLSFTADYAGSKAGKLMRARSITNAICSASSMVLQLPWSLELFHFFYP